MIENGTDGLIHVHTARTRKAALIEERAKITLGVSAVRPLCTVCDRWI